MKNLTIYLFCFLLGAFASCKKDEFVKNSDVISDTVSLVSGSQPQEYNLYDEVQLYLNATTSSAVSYQWLPTNETTSVIEFVPNDYKPTGWSVANGNFFGGYEVIITLPDTTIRMGIIVYADEAVVYCANTFVPNGNGLNDLWKVYYNSNAVTINELNIYNSRNKTVFHSGEGEEPAWDGKYKDDICESGIYYYTFHFTTLQGGKKSKEGMIELMR
jgi:gliding motility-associated-like protein